MTDPDRRLLFIQSIRDCADFLEQHPQVPAPYSTSLNAFVETREEMAQIARIGGGWTKNFTESYFSLGRTFGATPGEPYPPVNFEVNCARSMVCRKVKTGTKIVPAKPEHEEETFDWVCDDTVLLAETK